MGVSRFADAGAQRPPRLRQGARVAVVAPSSAIPERSQLDRGLKVLEQFGLEVVLGPHVRDLDGYLGGDDRARADDLFWALSDPVIDGVVCARGGYGGQRTLAALGADRIAELEGLPAKPVIGFSDITILHAFLSVRLGWVSFYGPGVSKLGGANEYTLAGVRRALFDAEPFTVAPNPADDWITTLVPGTAEGVLAGGVLPRLASLVGTPLQVDFADRVCFFEDTIGTVA
jgi:muramoyltetrapeptide carboxypeptidase